MGRIAHISIAVIAAVSTAGCTTIMDETTSAITKTVAPRADKLPDGNYVLPVFAAEDDGTVFSTSSPQAAQTSLAKMVAPMNAKERLYFARVFMAMGYYHGCKDRGQRHYQKNPFRSGNLGICNMTTFYSDSQPRAKALLEIGRPDSDVLRMMQKKRLVSGAPVGEPYQVGHGMAQSWSKWIAWSGHRLDGKTRSELLQEFLQKTNGVYGKNAR